MLLTVRLMLLAVLLVAACCPAAALGDVVVDVDDTRTYQTVDGFGAALTDTSAWLLAKALTADQRADLLATLFGAKRGGFSYLRLPMGSSDFRTREYTYDDVPAGEADLDLRRFSIAKDEEYVIPVLKQILAIDRSVKIMASPWSAPAWMKTTGRLDGGRLKDDPAVYAAYADYFVRFLQAYRAHGIAIDAVTLQNEPMHEMAGYPTMRMEPADQARLAKLLGPKLRAAGLKTKIVVWDHNWDRPDYPLDVLKDAEARRWVDGVAFHAYAGDPSAQSKVHDAYPDKAIYFTEISGGDWAKDFGGNLMWDMRNLIVGATRNWARTVLKWNLALDERTGPKLPGGADNCRGVVTIHRDTGRIVLEEDYYALAHAARFVRPGARRIDTDQQETVAFVNPDKTVALIAYNPDREPRALSIRWRGKAARVTLPPISAATLVWPPTGPALVWLTTGDQKHLLKRQADVAWVAG